MDTSALLAIVFREDHDGTIQKKLSEAPHAYFVAPQLFEAKLVLTARLGEQALPLLDRLLEQSEIAIEPFTEELVQMAMVGYLRYGKGRHPAALNYGDCMAYALAKTLDMPLLYTGDDFSLTDVARA